MTDHALEHLQQQSWLKIHDKFAFTVLRHKTIACSSNCVHYTYKLASEL